MFSATSSRSLRTATTRISQTTAQLHPRTPIRMAHNGTNHILNTGAKIPALGFGTWQDKEAQEPGALSTNSIHPSISLTSRSCHNRTQSRLPSHRHRASVSPFPTLPPSSTPAYHSQLRHRTRRRQRHQEIRHPPRPALPHHQTMEQLASPLGRRSRPRRLPR